MEKRYCIYCSKEFNPVNQRQIYCSNTCKVYEFRLRKNQRPNPYESEELFYKKQYSADVTKLREQCIRKNSHYAEGNSVCESVLVLLKLGHFRKIRQHEINYIFFGNPNTEKILNIRFDI
jgi:hypothetical protein